MKKFLRATVAAFAALCTFAFAACGNGEGLPPASETFTGTISVQSYGERAFLTDEVNGETTASSFVRYEKTADLTADDIGALNTDESITAGEKGNVIYTVSSAQASVRSASAATTQELSQEVYLLQTGSTYRYYTPAPAVDSNITKSYYRSVFEEENYTNCTADATSYVQMNVTGIQNGMEQSMQLTMSTSMKLQFTEHATKQEYTASASSQGQTFETTGVSYTVETTRGFVIVEKEGERYTYTPLSDYSVTETMMGNASSLFDHTYFIKTETGFSIRGDKGRAFAAKYLESAADTIPSSMQMNIPKLDYDFYISEGKVCKMTIDLILNGSYSESGITADCSFNAGQTLRLTDYGSTTFELPQEVRDFLEQNHFTLVG